MHTNCIQIVLFSNFAFEVHSNCNRIALELPSVLSDFAVCFSTLHYLCILCCTQFAIVFNRFYTNSEFPQGHYLLHSFCIILAVFIALELHSVRTRCALFSNIALFVYSLLHSVCICFQYVLQVVFISPRPLSIALFLHSLLHSTCIRIAFELHSSCTLFALVLHSLVNSPGAIIDCTICQLSCTCVSLFGKFPQGQHVLRYVCTLVCTLFAIVLHSLITLQYLCIRIEYELHSNCVELHSFLTLHSNCNRIAFEVHSNCTLLKRCTFCCTRCCIMFAIVLHCVCTLWSIPPGPLFLHSLLHSNCTRVALVLHSLVSFPGAIIDCILF